MCFYSITLRKTKESKNETNNHASLSLSLSLLQWYKVDKSKIREDLLDLWVPLGTGPNADQPDKAAEIFLMRSAERSDSLPLQAWHSLARSALSWFISRTSING